MVTLGEKIFSVFVNIPAILLIFYFFGNYLVIKKDILIIFLTLSSSILGLILNMSFGLLIGLLAFWVHKVKNFFDFYQMAFSLFGGEMVPLALFPKLIQVLAIFLPFRYVYSLPLEIYFGGLSRSGILLGFIVQIFWILIITLFLKFVWRHGLKQYSAFGG